MTQGVVIPSEGMSPQCREYDEEPGGRWLELVAAELLPLDLQVAAGRLPSVKVDELRAGQVAVARAASGELVSVQGGRAGLGLGAPSGTFATRFDPLGASVAPLPVGLDARVAAAGVSSVIAARLALAAAEATVGERVLVVGASGAVGSATASLARARGCEVVELTRANADEVLASADRPDVVVDLVGGPLLLAVIRAAGDRARHVLVGYVGDGVTTVPLPLLLVREHRLIGLNVYRTPEPEFAAAHVGALADLAEGRAAIPAHRLETVGLERVAEAYGQQRRVLISAQ